MIVKFLHFFSPFEELCVVKADHDQCNVIKHNHNKKPCLWKTVGGGAGVNISACVLMHGHFRQLYSCFSLPSASDLFLHVCIDADFI